MNMIRFAARLLIAFVLAIPAAQAQTPQSYNTVASIAALKAMTNRPQVVEVVDANPGIFNLSQGACAAADDIFQVQPTSGSTVCYTRMASAYAIGKDANLTVDSLSVGGGAALQAGVLSGYQSMWANQLMETVPGDMAAINWLANSSGIQTAGIWAGNSLNYTGLSTRFTRATDPPNVTRTTNGVTAPGNATLHFASTDGVTVGDFVNGSPNIPATSRVASKTATTVVMDAPTTGSGVASGVTLDFIGPYAIGTWMAYGNNNVLQLYAKVSDTVKPTNALMAVADCSVLNTYCSGANIIALGSTLVSTKLVGMEIDQSFQVGTDASHVGAGSGGLYINTFNGSNHAGAGNGPAVQLGGITGFWSNGFLCDYVIASGSCFGMGAGGNSVASMADSFNGTFGVGAYLLGNDTGSNNQRIVFRATSGANAAMYMDSSNVLNVLAAGRIININGSLTRVLSPNEQVASIVSSNASGYSLLRIENSSSSKAFDYGVDSNGGAYMRSLTNIAAGTKVLSLSHNGGATDVFDVYGNGDVIATGTIRANTGFSANGTAGVSKTVTVRDSAGTGTCTLVFTTGLYTGGTC